MSAALQRLQSRLETSTARVGVVGLGYVGLPVACLIAATGLDVTGVDTRQERVRDIGLGRSPIGGAEPGLADLLAEVAARGTLRATDDHTRLSGADVVVVCVETPVTANHQPDLEALRAACRSLGPVLAEGALVIVESTVAPGTIDRIVCPLLEETSGRRWGEGFFLGHCPERVMPGRLVTNMRTMSRVLGARTSMERDVMRSLYARYVDAELDVTDVVTAELVKTAENAYRDVNIAFANQVALICEAAGGDVWKVRDLVNKSPGRNMLLPGAGVGGHCIPKDPWLLAAAAGSRSAPLIRAAREVNDSMPAHVAALAFDLLAEAGVQPDGAEVAVLGAAYLEDSDDTRNSPTAALVGELEAASCRVRVHDPYVPGYETRIDSVLAGADVMIVMVAHSVYRGLDLRSAGAAMRHRLLVEGRRVFEPADVRSAGFNARVVGVAPDGCAIS
jgi:UDP-N-acetyl-D-mannosaminuronic acid dehydrogenase